MEAQVLDGRAWAIYFGQPLDINHDLLDDVMFLQLAQADREHKSASCALNVTLARLCRDMCWTVVEYYTTEKPRLSSVNFANLGYVK